MAAHSQYQHAKSTDSSANKLTITEHDAHSKSFSCFALPQRERDYHDSKYQQWLTTFACASAFENTSITQLTALSRLIPLLLCGEQSANFVFGQEAQRLQTQADCPAQNKAIAGLLEIESDEHFHDVALQAVLKEVNRLIAQANNDKPTTQATNRQAQLFYLQLGKTKNLTEHLAQIFHLDTCVTLIMSAMAKSNLGANHQVVKLFKLIQKDESKHVHICSEHIRYLGGDMQQLKKQAVPIKTKLVKLLATETDSFNQLGINPEQLFQRISK